MAQKLNPTIKLVSSTTAGEETSSDALAFTVTDSLTVTQPMIDIAQITLSTAKTLLIPTSVSAITYFYGRNDGSQTIVIETGGGQPFADLSAGEWCFFPVKGTKGLSVFTGAGTAVLEYGYWSKG
tara:strand:- start:147 stop:521 length:375 start_codon:yes stop_codon:yes gene_type:complete